MRYCRPCKKLSDGNPTFCPHCRRSFNVKRCPAGHENPRGSRFCKTCGSPDLSTPQPRRPVRAVLVGSLFFLILLLVTLAYIIYFIRTLMNNPSGLLTLMNYGVGLAVLWFLYITISSAYR